MRTYKLDWIKFAERARLKVLQVLLLMTLVIHGQAWAQQVEPRAGTWKTWVLTSGNQLRLPPPPSDPFGSELAELRRLESQRDAAAQDLVSFWNAGSPAFRWIEMTYALGPGANQARGLSLLSIAIYDATIAAWDSKYAYNRPRPSQVDLSLTPSVPNPSSPSYPSEHAVVAGAASEVLAYLFPAQGQSYRSMAEQAARSRVIAGVQYPSDITAGLELGRAVAAKVIEGARSDGSDRLFTGSIPTAPCSWRSETGATPVMPTAGTWRTWVLKSGDQFRPGPPPDCTSDAGKAEAALVRGFPRTFNSNEAAFYWQGARGVWNRTVSEKISEYGLDSNAPRAARAYALANIAFYDGMIACFDAKYTYWQIRPYQQGVAAVFPTPNHPSYPGAHACGSGAVASVLGYLFPRDAAALRQRADEAAESRIWAGIHYRSDTDVGLALGRSVGQLVIDRAKVDGSQFVSLVTSISFSPATVRLGEPFTATVSGTNLDSQTFIDLRFRRPGSTVDEVALNWQKGTSVTHVMPMELSTGMWLITGVRARQSGDSFGGDFVSVAGALEVLPK